MTLNATVYKVTVREGTRLVEYVISAPTPQHAVSSVCSQQGVTEALVWSVYQPTEWRK